MIEISRVLLHPLDPVSGCPTTKDIPTLVSIKAFIARTLGKCGSRIGWLWGRTSLPFPSVSYGTGFPTTVAGAIIPSHMPIFPFTLSADSAGNMFSNVKYENNNGLGMLGRWV